EPGVQARHTAEARRTEGERRLGDAKLEVGRLESDLALAAERLGNASQRRQTAADDRVQAERRAAQAEREHEAAAAERAAAERDLTAVQGELGARSGEEDNVRGRLTAERRAVRELEDALQRRTEAARALEIEGAALDRERSELREQLALDREHVGLAPAAQALLKVRNRFGDGVLGPLADFVRTSRRDAELAERLLGEWLHAVLVRDASVIDAIRAWHADTQPGPIVLLPA